MDRIPFNDNWLFIKGDTVMHPVTLPHDASLEAGRNAKAASGRSGAFFESGFYEYEKSFFVPLEWENKDLFLEFEGVYPTAVVYLNGKELGHCDYGYSMFRVKLSGIIGGKKNTVRVVVDDSRHPNSRWYAGAGIYRPVTLLVGDRCHVEPYGVRVTTKSYNPPVVEVSVNVCDEKKINPEILVEIFDGDRLIAEKKGAENVFELPEAELWDEDSPKLYGLTVTLSKAGTTLDKEEITFGIRLIEYSARGLFINGKNTLLKGGCIHSDNGILGAKSYEESEWRRIKILKKNGFNAIRSSHNPLCKAALEACDALGMYVLDETWDTWNKTKNPYDFGNGFESRFETDIISMVEKDYNHPSVIMYSIGNEVTEPATGAGMELGERLIKTVKKYDLSRPVTAGINLTLLFLASLPGDMLEQAMGSGGAESTGENQMSSDQYNELVIKRGADMTRVAALPVADEISTPMLDALDIAGYNYAVSRYENEGSLHPNRIVLGTETYCQDINITWPLVKKLPNVIGDFMWTAWDYLGEVGIGSFTYDSEEAGFSKNYPWLLADTGALDILGNPNAEAGLAYTVWTDSLKPYIGVTPANRDLKKVAKAMWRGSNALPLWSYENCDGTECEVEVYSAAPQVELFVNDNSYGKKDVIDYKASYKVVYESGKITAVSYDAAGNAIDSSSLISATGKKKVKVTCEEKLTKDDIFYYDISIVGDNGEIEGNYDLNLKVAVKGGLLLGFGSANPKTEENFLAGEYRTYFGRAQAVVRKTSDEMSIDVTIIE